MLQDTFKVTGKILLRRYDENGKLDLEREHKNLVVTTGKQLIASRLFCDTRAAINISSITVSGGIATVAFSSPQLVFPYDVGMYVSFSGTNSAFFNYSSSKKYFRVSSVTLNEITIDDVGAAGSGVVATGGQIDPLQNSNVKKMKVGEGDTVANLSDIALYSELTTGVDLFSSALDFEDDKASVVYIAFFPGTAEVIPPANIVVTTPGSGLREAALVNASNKMLCRTVFPTVTKTALQSLEIFWTVTIN